MSGQEHDTVLDVLPDAVVATMEVRDRWFAAAATAPDGNAFFLSDLLRWPVGSTLRVAFLGGDTELHRDIEAATRQITDAGNLTLDFGFDAATRRYRTWSTSDTEYTAEIRVSFDQRGFSSLIGRDSAMSTIGASDDPMGGRPYQRSLNLGGFPIQRPANWEGVVRHEFLHAIAFRHEHQHPMGGCDLQFRWEDDPGYLPTTDATGRYVTDSEGRRPGLYTMMAGPPNNWPRQKVDHNLRPRTPAGALIGDFDQSSVMLYRFPALYYRTFPNPCTPTGNGIDLSEGDVRAMMLAYPFDEGEAATQNARRTGVVETLSAFKKLPDDLRAALDNLGGRRGG